jgi:hypothetical protein
MLAAVDGVGLGSRFWEVMNTMPANVANALQRRGLCRISIGADCRFAHITLAGLDTLRTKVDGGAS